MGKGIEKRGWDVCTIRRGGYTTTILHELQKYCFHYIGVTITSQGQSRAADELRIVNIYFSS